MDLHGAGGEGGGADGRAVGGGGGGTDGPANNFFIMAPFPDPLWHLSLISWYIYMTFTLRSCMLIIMYTIIGGKPERT